MRSRGRALLLNGLSLLLVLAGRPAPAPPRAPAAILAQPGDAYLHLSSNPGNISGDSTYLDNWALIGNPNLQILAIHQLSPYGFGALHNDHPLGVWYHNGRWAIYNDDGAGMAQPLAWNVFVPPQDSTLLAHTSTITDAGGPQTTLDDPQLNGQPNAILFVQHVYNPGGGLFGTTYTHTVSVFYDLFQSKWAILNADNAKMAAGISFVVLKASPDKVAFQHITSNANIQFGDRTFLDNPWINGQPDALILVTQNEGNGVTNKLNNHRIGVWFDVPAQRWMIFNEDHAAMDSGLMFNVLVIPPKSGFFLQTATAGNTTLFSTRLDQPDLNNNPYARLYVMHNLTPPDGPNGVLADHPLGVDYDFGAQRWKIYNRDGAAMPAGSAYNVYYTWPRGNSFSVSASSATTVTASSLALHHPLLDGNPLALPQVSFNFDPGGVPGAAYGSPVSLTYDAGSSAWRLANDAGAGFPPGLSYNVLVSPDNVLRKGASGPTTVSNTTTINNPLTNDDPWAMLFVTRTGALPNDHNLGVEYIGNRWAIFDEDYSYMPLFSGYTVFVVKRPHLHLPVIFR